MDNFFAGFPVFYLATLKWEQFMGGIVGPGVGEGNQSSKILPSCHIPALQDEFPVLPEGKLL
jgi:hypothetical protein